MQYENDRQIEQNLNLSIPFDWLDIIVTIAGIVCAFIAFRVLVFHDNLV